MHVEEQPSHFYLLVSYYLCEYEDLMEPFLMLTTHNLNNYPVDGKRECEGFYGQWYDSQMYRQ